MSAAPVVASGPAPASAAPVEPSPLDRRLLAFTRELRCLVCQNESLADSQATLAADLRREIREQMAAGRSDEQILAFLTGRYGDFVRYRPPLAPRTWLLWAGPLAGAVAGLGALGWMIRRREQLGAVSADGELPAADTARARALLSGDDA